MSIVSDAYARDELTKRLPELPENQRWRIILGVVIRENDEAILRIVLEDYKWYRGWRVMRYPDNGSQVIERCSVSTKALTDDDVRAIVKKAYDMKRDMNPSDLFTKMLGEYVPKR